LLVDATFRAQDIDDNKIRPYWAVVIDVLRATTTITTALGSGCRALIPALEPEEARQRAAAWARHNGSHPLLGGERKARPIPGFDLGNSPQMYTAERVGGRVVFFTTTNGTRALRRCHTTRGTICACLRNAAAVAAYLVRRNANLVMLACSGREGHVAPEDVAVAGVVARHLAALTHVQFTPATREAVALAESVHDWGSFFCSVPAGRSLLDIGLHPDVTFCAQPDTSYVIPRYRRGAVIAGG